MAQTAALMTHRPGRPVVRSTAGDVRIVPFTLTISSYVTGGEVLDLDVLFGVNVGALLNLVIPNFADRQFTRMADGKIKASSLAGVEVSAATNIGAVDGFAICRP